MFVVCVLNVRHFHVYISPLISVVYLDISLTLFSRHVFTLEIQWFKSGMLGSAD